MDRIRAFFASCYFDERFKTKVHVCQVSLVIAMFVLSGVRMATKPKGMRTSRADTIGIVMGIKTIVVLSYQVLTSRMDRFRRWASLKANAILNTLEILFWFVVVIVTLMGISKYCKGVNCGMGWIMVIVATALTIFAMWTSVVSIQIFRSSKRARAISDGYDATKFPPSPSALA